MFVSEKSDSDKGVVVCVFWAKGVLFVENCVFMQASKVFVRSGVFILRLARVFIGSE